MSESSRPHAKDAKGHIEDPVFGRIWIKETEGMQTSKKNLQGRYCNKLYTWLEIDMHGRAWMCCPSWLPYPIGNVLKDSIEDMWNGEKARILRNQIFSGEWNYCQHDFCPMIASDSLPSIEDVKENKNNQYHDFEVEAIKNGNLISTSLPTNINFSNDESCNLKCPSCRTDKLLFTEGPLYERRKQINDKIFNMFFETPSDRKFSIFVTGSGDPFASKIYRDMLQKIDGSLFPNLTVNLQTNGVMFTPKMWEKINKIHNNLGSCRISLDAGTKDTYENKTRLNGDWDLLLKNCDYLDIKSGEYKNFRISYDFVVQVDNYHEMPEYIKLVSERYPNAHDINFSLVTDWGTWSKEDYDNKCIWKDSHPEYEQFLSVLRHPYFKHPKVKLGNVQNHWQRAQFS